MIGAARDRVRALRGASEAVPGGRVLLQGQVAAGALVLVTTIAIARALGGEEFGRYALILAVVLVVAQVLDSRTWEAATRFAVQHLASGDRRGARATIEMAHLVSFLGGLVAAALLTALSVPLADWLLGDPELSTALTVYALVAPFAALQAAAAIPFRVLDRFSALAALTVLAPALRLVGAVAALGLGAELLGVVAALAAAEGIAALVFVALAQLLMARELGGHVGRDRVAQIVRESGRAWRVLLASNVYGSLRFANEQLDVVIVGAVASPAAAGVVKLARTLAQPMTMLQKPFQEAIYPRLAAAAADGRLPAERLRIRAATRFAAATLFPLAVLLALVSPWLIPALVGDAFEDAWQVVLPIALGTALVGTFFWLHPAALVSGLQGRSLGSLALATLAQIALVALLVPAIGIAGAGIAYAIAMATWIALLAPAVRREMRGGAVEDTRMIVVGPTPPPFHGGAVMTGRLLSGLRRNGLLAAHLDTRDPRSLDSIGRLDLRNIWLAIVHGVRFASILARCPGATVYVPISQSRWGFLRDSVFLLGARIAGRRRIVHLHGGYFADFYRDSSRPYRRLIRMSLRGVEQAWVLTPRLAPMFAGLVPAERVAIVPNAVVDTLTGDGKRVGLMAPRRETAPAPIRLLYFSNLLPGKGWADLLAAVELLAAEDGQPLQIRLVGEASEATRANVRDRAGVLAALGVKVELRGTRTGEEKLAEYRWADLFVYPSHYRYDGQPLVLLEAMAAGLPIVTTAVGGVPDTITDGESAIVVQPRDVVALARSIRVAANDTALRRRLGEAARRRYFEYFCPDSFDRRVEQLVRAACASGSRQRTGPLGLGVLEMPGDLSNGRSVANP